MTLDHETTMRNIRVFGTDGSSRELAYRVADELRSSAAWLAFTQGFGLDSDHRLAWISVDGCPFTPIELGLDGSDSGSWSRIDGDERHPDGELTDYLAQP